MSSPENKAAEQATENVQQGIDISQAASTSALARLAEMVQPLLGQVTATAQAYPQFVDQQVAANRGTQLGQYQGLSNQLSERQAQTGASQAGQQRQLQAATGQNIANAETQIRSQGEADFFARLLQALSANSGYAQQAAGYEFAPANTAVQGAASLGPAIQAEAQQTTPLGTILSTLGLIAAPLLGGLSAPATMGTLAGAGTLGSQMGQNILGQVNLGAFQ